MLLTRGRALMTYVVPKCHLEHDSITRPACSCNEEALQNQLKVATAGI